MAVLVTCMTKEYSRIYDLQRIKSRTKQRKNCETEAWWKKKEKIDDPKKFLLLLFCPIKT